jgi:flagellar hook protein FlgE
MDVTSVALSGMQNAQNTLQKSAERLASVSPENSDSVELSSQMVAMLSARNQYQTNAAVVRTADDLSKKVLDMLA